LAGIDTRALVRLIRSAGALKGVISSVDLDPVSLVKKAKESPSLVGRDLVREVIPERARQWNEALYRVEANRSGQVEESQSKPHVVCLDFGMKWNIARHLFERGNRVTILPGTATAAEVMQLNPDGIFLSNGPGDPEPLTYAINTIRELIGKRPMFGICLGHQLLSLACGAKTFKMKFGHRGANQPVLNTDSGRIEITCQNHGFAVDEASLPSTLRITHRNVNDDTIAWLSAPEVRGVPRCMNCVSVLQRFGGSIFERQARCVAATAARAFQPAASALSISCPRISA
jgi:carbamoyl-phosphate synthase small subunit